MARSAVEPMSVNEMNEAIPYEEVNRIRTPIPKEAKHPDPCPQPPTCYNCMTPGHVQRNCTLPAAPANPANQQPATYQPQPQPKGGQRGGQIHRRKQDHHGAPPGPNHQAAAGPAAINLVGQRLTHQPQTVRALQQHHPTHPSRNSPTSRLLQSHPHRRRQPSSQDNNNNAARPSAEACSTG